MGVCKVNHLLRTVPRHYVEDVFSSFDTGLRSTLTDILKCPINESAWRQATLPFRLGGLGLREASPSAAAAFVASINNTRLLAADIFPEEDPPIFTGPSPLSFPGEDSSRSHLMSQLEDKVALDDLRKMSQSSIQAALDDRSLDEFLSTLDVCGKARVSTLASSTDTSSWLRAPPIQSLGLAMPSSSFALACRIWLGIPSFPASTPLLCPCGSAIDPNGDHLLGCGHGPLRIRRHDILRDTLFQTLLLDNRAVRREQRVSGQSKDRPGDIFHPDFSDGIPTFFDVSVCSPLNPGIINSTSALAGGAGLQAEMSKDNKHADCVEAAGGKFIPLVVETLGRWTPFARNILRQIASRSTISSGLSPSQATNNLIQLLSVKLWQANANMISNRLSLFPSPPHTSPLS